MLSEFDPPILEGTAVRINDCTLREGEQSLDIALTESDKVTVAGWLAQAGVDSVQLSHTEPEDVLGRLVATSRPSTTEVLVLGFQDSWPQQVQKAKAAGADGVNFAFRSSPILLGLLGWSEDRLVTESTRAVSYAAELGLRVAFSPTDGTRASADLLTRLYREVAAAGADLVYVCDTVGVAGPLGFDTLVRRAREASGLEVGVHCHNDLGLALANALAGCGAGATVVDTCINGVGERTGNPALDEVAVALELLLGATQSVALDRLSPLSRDFAELVGATLPASKAHVGDTAFAQKMDIHVLSSIEDERAYVPYPPATVGGELSYRVGKNSGPVAVAHALVRLTQEFPDQERLSHVVREVQVFAERERRALTDEELLGLWSAV